MDNGKNTTAASMPTIEAVVDLIEIAGRLPASTAVVPGGHRVEDLRLVESARDHGIVDRIVLIGDPLRIAAGVEEVGIEIAQGDIIAAEDDQAIAAAAVDLVRADQVDIVLKGDISTPIINRAMLPLAVRPTVSLATVFDAVPIAGGRPMVLTDPGVTTVCNLERLTDLVRNAVDVAHRVLGISRPRVAMLSANEKQVPSLPSTQLGLRIAELNWPDADVCGPLSFDLATDPESVEIKGLPALPQAALVAGRADVLVCPGIDAANVLYKVITALNKFGLASLASITVGFPTPYVILSRSDSLETRLVSIALCAAYAQQGTDQEQNARS
jgi:phosphotransacetylase